MNKVLKGFTVAAVAGGVILTGSAAGAAPPAPAGTVDVAKYVGKWYQVAAVPQWFEIQCVKNVTAEYAATATGVSVKNRCASWFGWESGVDGEAKPLDATNARLNVSFLKWDGKFIHQATANYIVVGLDAGYKWAVVTDEGRKSGFVLSREPKLGEQATADAQAALRKAGVDPCTLKVTEQDGGRADKGAKFC